MTAKTAYSLTVSPTRLIVPAGKTQESKVFDVSNSGSRGLNIETAFSDITQTRSGVLKFAAQGPFSAAAWVKADPQKFHLIPGEHRKVRVTIRMPAHSEPGDHQVGVVFRVPAQRGQGNLAVSGAIGAEILIAAPGKAIQNIALSGLRAPTFSGAGPYL